LKLKEHIMETQTDENKVAQKKRLKGNSPSPKWCLRLLILLCLLIIAAAFTPEILYLLSHESTDDAYFRSTIVPISAEVSGQIIKVFAKDNQMVRKGDILLEIDPRDYQLALILKKTALASAKAERDKEEAAIIEARKSLAVAQAELADAEVNEQFAAKEKRRYDGLAKMGAVAQHKYEQVNTTWQTAQAKRAAAAAAVAKSQAAIKTLQAGLAAQESKIKEAAAKVDVAELALSRTTIRAPINGRISQKNADEGKYVQVGQPLLALVDPENTWIAANFKETQIDKIKVGQEVDIKVDAYPDLLLKGHVDSIQAGTGAVFSLLPPENATGNFVKIVQRLPVKIVVDSPPDPTYPLWPGLSAVPSIDVASSPTK
jgi:membrane fusion protein, multidrug efflux system